MPSLEQIYEKLDILERKIADVRDGFSLLDDTVADFFNIATIPGREIENPRVDELINVEMRNGVATIIDPTLQQGHIKSTTVNFEVDKPRTISVRPVGEDIRAQYLISPSVETQEEFEEKLYFESNPFSSNIEIIADSGQRDYGARLTVTGTTIVPYQYRWEFENGQWGNLWTLEKSNVQWDIISLVGASSDYVLQCTATEPATIFPLPQYALGKFGVAAWSDIRIRDANEIKASMTTVDGTWVRMGLAIRLKNAINGYFVMLESDITGSYTRLYKIRDGYVTKIAETSYSGSYVLNHSYEVWAKTDENNIQIHVDGNLVMDYDLEPLDIVSTEGDFGVIAMATSTVRFDWVETIGNARNIISPLEGTVTTSPLVVTDIGQWQSIELDSTILQGRVEIDYSLDGGLNWTNIPAAVIEYPDPVTKVFDLSSVPVDAGHPNTIVFRVRLYETGLCGWVRHLNVKYLTPPEMPYILDNVEVYDNRFQLVAGELFGSLTTKSGFLPQQIYSWDKIVTNHFIDTITDPITSLTNQATVTVDSHQDPYISDYIVDADMATYWESKRGADSWVMFEFPNPVEIHRFRWVKKSPTDGATFYHFQIFNEETGVFNPVQTFGYEVNSDIMHVLDTPVMGTKFRIFINCVQPMTFGNARFIDIFGKSVISSTNVSYQYSLDDGISFEDVPDGLSLASLPIDQSVKFRILFSRTDPASIVYLREAFYRFIGRDLAAIQVTNLQYDVWIGDKFVYNITPFEAVDIRCVSGTNVQIKIRFLIHPDYLLCGIKPWLSGYRIGVSSSHYQEQIDALQAHINSVIWRADRDPEKDLLIEAVLGLISYEVERISRDETDVDKIILSLMSHLNTEISKNRSRIVLGDVGHLDESLPSELFDADILL